MSGRILRNQVDRDSGMAPRRRMKPAALVGLTAHGLLGILHLVTGLLATVWTVLVLWTVWTALLAMAVNQRHRQPMLAAVAPVVDVAVWLLVVLVDAAITG